MDNFENGYISLSWYIVTYRIRQNILGGKFLRLEQKWKFDRKIFTVEASCNNECLV